MASFPRDLWFMTPLQAVAMISSAMNCGASGQQSPLTMPTLGLKGVPVQYTAIQIRYLLARSEMIFPPLNAFGTLTNVVASVIAFLNRNESPAAQAKLPYAVAAAFFNIAVTVWTLSVMVPMNNSMRRDVTTLEQNSTSESAAKSLTQVRERWSKMNLVRAALMMGAAVSGLLSLLQDGAVVKL